MLQDGNGGAASSVVGNEGELCCTALSSSSSRSSSDRLLPRAEVMAAADESDDFCLLGKLQETQRDSCCRQSSHGTDTTCDTSGRKPVDVVLFNVGQRRAAAVPGPGALLGRPYRLQRIHQSDNSRVAPTLAQSSEGADADVM